MEGVGTCSESCCNLDNDPFGEWCMVDDIQCEDSDWGYCQPKVSGVIQEQMNCVNLVAWADKDGDNCEAYRSNAWCSTAPGTAVAGVGWHDEWGTIRSYGSGPGNISAFTACCSCGGGTRDVMAASTSGRVRHTFNGCECKGSWSDPDLGTCANSCCNPDYDPYGDWCLVKDEECEDSSWGYCEAAGVNTVTSSTIDGCTDTKDWKDSDGDGCFEYADNSWCTSNGGYDNGWHEEWGTFDSFSSNGKTASKACCACGGGDRAGGAVTRPTTPPWTPETSFFERETWNDCACKTYWSDEVLGSCASSCCNPDEDEFGEWCMVQDPACEDSDWGYCRPALLNPTRPSGSGVPGCTDVADWKDSDGDGCEEYSDNAWCTSWGLPGVGWHDEWGSLGSFSTGGNTALTACCVCGGGKDASGNMRTAPTVPTASPTDPFHLQTPPRETWNGCACTYAWDADDNCAGRCCNPDRDPFGDWCYVADMMCEDSDWGYCKPEGADEITPYEYTVGGCTDSPGWKDSDGDDCTQYRLNNWCNNDGGYNAGWNEEWGTFASFAGGPLQESAPQACCACGRGSETPLGSLGNTAASVAGRVTLNQCRCLKSWAEEGLDPPCETYCCNPDADPSGDWCFVEDPECEESDWGYCLEVSFGPGEVGAAGVCTDVPEWKDSDGDDCDTYKSMTWCEDGGVGSGWHEEWGAFTTFGLEGKSASDACCACGGGTFPVGLDARSKKMFGASVIVSLILILTLGVTACYYRRSYHKIAYEALESSKQQVQGATTVGRTVDDI